MNGGGAIWLVGAGNMGGAMLRGWLASGVNPKRITVITRTPRELPEGVSGVTAPPKGSPDLLVLAMKPQQLADVAATPFGSCSPRLLVSVLAGVDCATLAARFDAQHVVRLMPNLPVAIGQGVSLLQTESTDPGVRAEVEALARPLGAVEWIEDPALFDAATALAGSGPGFLFKVIAALAEAGRRLGLDGEQAARMARATVAGSAAMAAQSAEDIATLAQRVASPGGSTREGYAVLDREEALVRLLTDTLAAAERRNAEMAAEARR